MAINEGTIKYNYATVFDGHVAHEDLRSTAEYIKTRQNIGEDLENPDITDIIIRKCVVRDNMIVHESVFEVLKGVADPFLTGINHRNQNRDTG